MLLYSLKRYRKLCASHLYNPSFCAVVFVVLTYAIRQGVHHPPNSILTSHQLVEPLGDPILRDTWLGSHLSSGADDAARNRADPSSDANRGSEEVRPGPQVLRAGFSSARAVLLSVLQQESHGLRRSGTHSW